LWREVNEFFDSDKDSRHYRLDRASGEIQFGDGKHGRIPPSGGDNIRAFSYQAGGGAAGNVRAGEIRTLVTSIGGIESVVNPIDAGGGSEEATLAQMLELGPAKISNRGRAVTTEDFESLAKEASRQVRKVRCVSNRNASGRSESGWVALYIIPDSPDAAPMASIELRRTVNDYLVQYIDLDLLGQQHVSVGAAQYVYLGVQATVYATSLNDIAAAEIHVRDKLNAFLHPLTGGPHRTGWEFGAGVAASDIYLLLEEIEQVDHVGELLFLFDGKRSKERADIGANAIIAAGEHLITVLVDGAT
jgi:predicted phage baseplate assembly protein